MANTSVMFCYINGNNTDVGMAWNTEEDSEILTNPDYGLFEKHIVLLNDELNCSFTRTRLTSIKRFDGFGNITFEFDLSKDYYLLLARGPTLKVTVGEKSYPIYFGFHDINKISDNTMFLDFEQASTLPANTTTSTTPLGSSTTGAPKNNSKGFEDAYKGCYKDWGCFGMKADGTSSGDCEQTKTCDVLATFCKNAENDDVEFTLHGKISNNNYYLALGISDTAGMGDTSVMFCYYFGAASNASTGVGMAWNTDDNSLVLDNPKYGLSKISTNYTDGVLNCQFTRDKITKVQIPGNKNGTIAYFDLTKSYFLLMAMGPTVSSTNGRQAKTSTLGTFPYSPSYHQKSKVISANKIFLNVSSHIKTKGGRAAVRAHGCMMVISWILLINVGMFTAKFCKKMLPETKILGAQVWFRIHQGCMFAGIAFSLIAVAVLFADRGIEPLKWAAVKINPHSALGLTAICLGLIQPIIALLRPKPGTKGRLAFRIVHSLVGNIASIIGGVAMYYATTLDAAELDENSWIILVVQGIFLTVLSVGFAVYTRYTRRRYQGEYFDKGLFGGYVIFVMIMMICVFAMFSIILSSGKNSA